jgi:hypothetical protein
VDFRPELGAVDYRRKFERENRYVTSPVRIFRPQPHNLEQKDAWALAARLCRVTDSGDLERIEGLQAICNNPPSWLRNQILYDSVFWKWREDFGPQQQTSDQAKMLLRKADELVEDLSGALSTILRILNGYTSALCAHVGIQPSALPSVASLPSGTDALLG